MAVEACMTPNLRADDSDDDDEPLVFKRTKPNQLNSASKGTSSSLRPDKHLVKSGGSDGRSLNNTGSHPQKGSMNPSSKPMNPSSKPMNPSLKPSSSRPGSVMQKSPPPSSGSQKSPQLNSLPRKSPPLPARTPPSSVAKGPPMKSPPSSVTAKGPPMKSLPSSVTAKGPPMKSPPSNGASSMNHPIKKDNTSVVKEEKPSPIKVKSSNDESEDSEDDKPIGQKLVVKGKNSDVKVEDSDSDDDKPLSARVSSGTFKVDVKVGERGPASGGQVQMNKIKPGSAKTPDDSDDEIPLFLKMKSSVVASSSKITTQNGSIKREYETTKKVTVSSVKRPSVGGNSSESLNKKAKLSNASSSAKQESKDDDDHIPISQRMNKSVTVNKKVVTKVDSKLKKVDKKSKKIIKKSQYSRSSKELPNSGDAQKWTTLEHNGVIFPPPYKPHGVKMLYDGQPVTLTPEQEEVATMYAVMLETDYVKKDKFNENFFNDWKKILGKNHVIQDLKKCDFTPIYEWHLREKEKKKQMSTEEKKAVKEEKMKLEEKYMWAILDGVKERVGNFRVEPPGLFRGRGEHPKMGKLKKRIFPSDITINIGKGAPIPECPMPGQRWKEVRHDNTVTWLAYWIDPINSREFKYVFLAASSSLKGQSDKEKYEKARLLKDYIEGIRSTYTKNFTSKDMTKRQIAVATYLIDRLALRAGNEKDDDEADTVGCCTLKVENVKPIPPNILEFDFLGKDSIKYYKQFEAEPLVYKAVEQFREGKQGSDNLFDKLDTSKLNAHLKELMPGLTAKVFRTFNASYTLDDMLVQGAGSGDVQQKLAIYNTANKEVAIICNHQRSVSKTHSAQMERLLTRINDAKAELNELETDWARAKKGKPPLMDSDGKRKRNLTPEAIEKKMQSIKAKIDKFERDMHTKEEMKEIALGTSKINYLDPRITVAWCKRNEVPIERIFNKSLIAKFSWAMDAEPDFRF